MEEEVAEQLPPVKFPDLARTKNRELTRKVSGISQKLVTHEIGDQHRGTNGIGIPSARTTVLASRAAPATTARDR